MFRRLGYFRMPVIQPGSMPSTEITSHKVDLNEAGLAADASREVNTTVVA